MFLGGVMSIQSYLASMAFTLGVPRWRRRFAGAERDSRVSQHALRIQYERMRAAEHAPRGPFRLLERRHGLAEIVERGAGGLREESGERRVGGVFRGLTRDHSQQT